MGGAKQKKLTIRGTGHDDSYSLWNYVVVNRRMGLNPYDIAKKLKVPCSLVLKFFDLMDGKEPKNY